VIEIVHSIDDLPAWVQNALGAQRLAEMRTRLAQGQTTVFGMSATEFGAHTYELSPVVMPPPPPPPPPPFLPSSTASAVEIIHDVNDLPSWVQTAIGTQRLAEMRTRLAQGLTTVFGISETEFGAHTYQVSPVPVVTPPPAPPPPASPPPVATPTDAELNASRDALLANLARPDVRANISAVKAADARYATAFATAMAGL